jgi:hypothetical protein
MTEYTGWDNYDKSKTDQLEKRIKDLEEWKRRYTEASVPYQWVDKKVWDDIKYQVSRLAIYLNRYEVDKLRSAIREADGN